MCCWLGFVMITNHRKVVWAEELGIDMEKLRREHPDHWDQIMMKKRIGVLGAGTVFGSCGG